MTGDALAEMEHKHALDTICRINERGSLLGREWESTGGDETGRVGGGQREGIEKRRMVSSSLFAAQEFLSITTVSDRGTTAEEAQWIKEYFQKLSLPLSLLSTVILWFLWGCRRIGATGEFWDNEGRDQLNVTIKSPFVLSPSMVLFVHLLQSGFSSFPMWRCCGVLDVLWEMWRRRRRLIHGLWTSLSKGHQSGNFHDRVSPNWCSSYSVHWSTTFCASLQGQKWTVCIKGH